METPEAYKVWYSDGDKVKEKDLIFMDTWNDDFLEFINPQRKCTEIIPKSAIRRMERREDNNETKDGKY